MPREVDTLPESWEPDQEDLDQFDALVSKATELHRFTWCCKDNRPRATSSLRGRECMYCPEFVLRGGVCDPL